MSIDLLSNKPVVTILLILLLGSSGLGVTNLYANSENSTYTLHMENKLHEHVLDENSHPITSYKIETLIEKIDELKEDNKSIKNSIDKLTFLICTHNGYDCDI